MQLWIFKCCMSKKNGRKSVVLPYTGYKNGIPADISDTAATFVCNRLLYGILHEVQKNQLKTAVGWAHLPMLPSTATISENLGKPSMSLDTSIQGIRYAIEAISIYDKDVEQSPAAGLQI